MSRSLGAISLVFALFVGLSLSGCMLGPDYARPDTPANESNGYFRTPSGWIDPNNPDAIGPWWEHFGDPVTGELVLAALENNYDLRAAAARVQESRAILGQVHGQRWPQVSYGLDRTRAKNTFYFFGEPFNSFTTVYNQSFSVNYITDLFGKLRRSEQAAFADMLSTENAQQALTHGIIAQVVRTRTRIATQQKLLDISQENIESRTETLEIVERRYSRGLVPPLDVHLARENLADVTSLEPRIRQGLIQTQNSLDVLVGKVPASSDPLPGALPDQFDLSEIPLSVPASLLDRRPDVRAAEMQLAAATERIGVSIAAMFPDLTITGNWGTTSDGFRGLGFSQAEVYSLVMRAMAPIFAGGSLKAQVEASKARTEQAAANYAQVILTAMKEVEDALVAHQMLNERLVQLRIKLVEGTAAEKLARSRYQKGLEKILIVIDTEQRRRLAENEIALTLGDLYEARISLYLALGGDWRPTETESAIETAQTNDETSIMKQEI